MFWFVLIEVLVIFACIFISKKLVEKRKVWLNKFIPIGKDDPQIIKEMKHILCDIIATNKFEMSDEMERYKMRINAKDGYIQSIAIETAATRMSWGYNEGWKEINLAYSEKGAIAQIAFILWLIALALQVVLAVVAFIVWMSKRI